MNITGETGQDSAGTIIFVYGTLMRGEGNHTPFLGTSAFLGEGLLEGYALYDLGWFPGIKPSPGGSVKGELYRVDAPTLTDINRLEGEGSLYRLVWEPVQSNGETIEHVGVYVYLHSVDESSYIGPEKQPWRGRR